MAIRPIAPDDFAALTALDALVAHQAPGWAAVAAVARDAGDLALYCGPGCAYLALGADGEVVGYLLAQPVAFDGDAPLSIWVDAVAVAPAHRRRGIATRLYAALAATARAQRTRGILTRLPADPAALALHENVGFTPHIDDSYLWRLG